MQENTKIRPQAEERYREELAALAAADTENKKPQGWKLSPRAVRDFILGRREPLEWEGREVRVNKNTSATMRLWNGASLPWRETAA